MTRLERTSSIKVSERKRKCPLDRRITKYEAINFIDLKFQISKQTNSHHLATKFIKSQTSLTYVKLYFLALTVAFIFRESQAHLDVNKIIINEASFIVHNRDANRFFDDKTTIRSGSGNFQQKLNGEELKQDETEQKIEELPEERTDRRVLDEDKAKMYLNSVGRRSVFRTSRSILNRKSRSNVASNAGINKSSVNKVVKIGRISNMPKVRNPINRPTRGDNPPQTIIPQAQTLRTSVRQNGVKCALILQRTYVKKVVSSKLIRDNDYDSSSNSNNDLNDKIESSQLQPTGKQERVCITYEDVNKAIAKAKQQRGFISVPNEEINSIEPSPPVISELGELNQEVTRILTQKFDLSADEILSGLPLIDMSQTDFWSICPLMVKPVLCDPTGRFRSFTGHCNNLNNPAWGAAQTPFVRYLAPAHPDGIHLDRVSALDGSELPSPRLVTSMIHRDHDQPSGDLSLLIMVWGQIIDHDVALAAPPRDEEGMDFNCCKRQHPNCKPIRIPDRDPLYSRYNQKCMDFKRSLAGLRPNCALGPRVHINTITSTLDANTIYGSTKAIADQLRTFSRGLLRVQNVFKNMNLKPLMPQQTDKPDLDCFERPTNTYCFLGGDERVNEQPTLTALHTLYVRDHNRIAEQLGQINSHWDDDRIYHETRHIEAAIVQHLLINEYLPLLIGHEIMSLFNLTSVAAGKYWNGYDSSVTPSISHGFSTAAFRQGHTFIQGKVRLYNSGNTHDFTGSEMLRNLFKRPFHYYRPGRMDQIVDGIVNTPAQVYDPFITEEISGHLFQEPGFAYGMDLPAINLARGREQGTPGYNAFREWCGLPKAETFEDLQPYMNNQTAYLYSKLYKHVDDIDLWSGGISERRMSGAQIGPTFACIIARQFANIKCGDRFWYENPNFPSSFNLDQLREIKKATQARTICYNSDNIQTIQRKALKLPHPIYNPRVSCSDIPDLDLSYWQEDPSNPGSFLTSNSGS